MQRSTISATTSSTRAGSSERASPSTRQRSGTTLVDPVPPRTEPTLAVVWSSIRPSGIEAMASAAASTALRPSSGRMPAWAALPKNEASSRK